MQTCIDIASIYTFIKTINKNYRKGFLKLYSLTIKPIENGKQRTFKSKSLRYE
mgnify:FL=1